MQRQFALFQHGPRDTAPFHKQLLKWVGNKQRFAHEIVSYFPLKFGTYFEPFLGAAGVLATLAPERAIGSDSFKPLVEIWRTLKDSPDTLKKWYFDRWNQMTVENKENTYEKIKASYNANPNGADLLFLCRSCYGGVVRFRQADGYMSTPCGVHQPIPPKEFSKRVDEWHRRTAGTQFILMDYSEALEMAQAGDLVYCDPPYSHSQTILYGSQSFEIHELFGAVEKCKSRGVSVALSLDGLKKSGTIDCRNSVPKGLFKREIFVHCGRSMLKRFQMSGKSLEEEVVSDRLFLTY